MKLTILSKEEAQDSEFRSFLEELSPPKITFEIDWPLEGIYKVLYLNIRLKMAITALNCSDELFRTFESWGYQMARTTMSKRMLTTSMPKHKITEKNEMVFLFNSNNGWLKGIPDKVQILWKGHKTSILRTMFHDFQANPTDTSCKK